MTATLRTSGFLRIVITLAAVSFYAPSVIADSASKKTPSKPIEKKQTVNTKELSKSTKKKQPVDIESNTMEIIDAKNQAIFTGKVVAKRGETTLHAAKLVADFIKEKKKDGTNKTVVTFLNATGGVLIITKTQRITGKWARMDVKADKAVVGGDRVVVKQGNSIITGKKLNVNLKTDQSIMTGGRVKGTFTPQ